VALRWDDIDLSTGRLHVRRAKSGDASVHPISARESRALRKLLREAATSPYVFISVNPPPSTGKASFGFGSMIPIGLSVSPFSNLVAMVSFPLSVTI
jgi:type 1 fimbriae regulatory protein FimB/type 1 fimbriae regulatory protein FimE